MKYPNIQRFPGGASNDLIPDLQHPKNPVPALDINNMPEGYSFVKPELHNGLGACDCEYAPKNL